MDETDQAQYIERLNNLRERIQALVREIELLAPEQLKQFDAQFIEYYNELRESLLAEVGNLPSTRLVPRKLYYLLAWQRPIAVLLSLLIFFVGSYVIFPITTLLLTGGGSGMPALGPTERAICLGPFSVIWAIVATIVAFIKLRPSTQEVLMRTRRLAGHLQAHIREIAPGLLKEPPEAQTGASGDVERLHLETQRQELNRRYEQLTERIAALDTDFDVELDSERKLTLKERRERVVAEREKMTGQLREIERQLAGANPLPGT